LRHPSFTVVTQKRQKRKFASPVRNVYSTSIESHNGDDYCMGDNMSFTVDGHRVAVQTGVDDILILIN
jgi:hypothetical protein